MSPRKPPFRLLPRWRRLPWKLVLAAALLLGGAQAIGLDGRLPRLFSPISAAHAAEGSAGYRVRIDRLALPGVAGNLSGLAWDGARRHLWAVVNQPAELLALDPGGEVLARYPLAGFDDVEGVAWVAEGLLVVAEERRQALVAVTVPTTPEPIERSAQRVLAVALAPGGNDGIEGLGYDAAGDRLFAVKEHSPRRLYEIAGLRRHLAGGGALALADRSAWVRDEEMAADFASVEYDPRSGHLLLLSEAARLVVVLDGAGRARAVRSLAAGSSGLARRVPQPEGIALDPDGTLYLVSEPNLFYTFAPD